jgi:glycerate kinase
VTGEGAFDATSFGGKVVGRMLDRLAGRIEGRDIRGVVVAGRIADDLPRIARLSPSLDLHSLSDIAGSSAAAMSDPLAALREAGRRAARAMDSRIDLTTQRSEGDARFSQ